MKSNIKIFNLEKYLDKPTPCYDRDYFKICILEPESKMHYANKSVHLKKTAVVFSNPMMPYEWEAVSPDQFGIFCQFNLEFLDDSKLLKQSILDELVIDALFYPKESQAKLLYTFFNKMMEEYENESSSTNEVLRMYVKLIIHESLKMKSDIVWTVPTDASSRITSLFIELLNNQFHSYRKDSKPFFKMPNEFANQLAIHVNHLNDSVHKTLNKSTTQIINEKMISESKKLLRHSTKSVSEIAYLLDFEYANNFSKFFKKHTGTSPATFRNVNL
nr:helix-turn-helix domain-containing protein [uncultured Chryseobacterium sp.]